MGQFYDSRDKYIKAIAGYKNTWGWGWYNWKQYWQTCSLRTPQHEVRKLGDVQLEGSNASAEEMDEGTEEASESGVDLVLNHRWVAFNGTDLYSQSLGWLRLVLPRRMTTWPTSRTT